jgi:DNA repair protein RadC
MYYEVLYKKELPEIKKIRTIDDVYALVKQYCESRQEQKIVVTLDGGSCIIGIHLVNIGTANKVISMIRDIFYRAIKDNAVEIIICHNHPGGILDPSPSDFESADRLSAAGLLLGIPVKENLIISEYGFASIKPTMDQVKKMMEGYNDV